MEVKVVRRSHDGNTIVEISDYPKGGETGSDTMRRLNLSITYFFRDPDGVRAKDGGTVRTSADRPTRNRPTPAGEPLRDKVLVSAR